jgi:hypothetical protein
MIKNRQLFKEDKLIRTKLIQHYPLSENSEDEREIRRGRQMTTANIVTYKKNNSTTCESKEKEKETRACDYKPDHDKLKKPKLIKRIHTHSLNSSIDSDCSIKNRKYRTKPGLIKQIPTPMSNQQSCSEDDSNTSGYYEENLFNEIERILIEIINNHINTDRKKNDKDVMKFQNHVSRCIYTD